MDRQWITRELPEKSTDYHPAQIFYWIVVPVISLLLLLDHSLVHRCLVCLNCRNLVNENQEEREEEPEEEPEEKPDEQPDEQPSIVVSKSGPSGTQRSKSLTL